MVKINTNKQERISHTLLTSHLHYNTDTGLLTYKYNYYKAKEGDTAGWIDGHGYRMIRIDRIVYAAHRLIWFYFHKEWPMGEIDHINGNRSDNRIANLRDVSASENRRNSSKRNDNTSGIPGVSRHTNVNKWRAEIWVNGKSLHLGLFDTKIQAAQARKEAEIKYNYHPNHGKLKQ